MYSARDTEVGNVMARQKNPKCTIHSVHAKLGYLSDDLMRETAKQLGWENPRGS